MITDYKFKVKIITKFKMLNAMWLSTICNFAYSINTRFDFYRLSDDYK